MERATTEITLPESKAKVVLYSYLTGGEFRDIQRRLADKVAIQVEDGKVRELQGMQASMMIDEADFTVDFLVKEIFTADGAKVEDVKTFIYNLSIDDNKFIFDKAGEISAASTLSKEAKKK